MSLLPGKSKYQYNKLLQTFVLGTGVCSFDRLLPKAQVASIGNSVAPKALSNGICGHMELSLCLCVLGPGSCGL